MGETGGITTPRVSVAEAMTDPVQASARRVLALAVVDGVGTGAHQALTTVLVARQHGLVAAGVVAVAALGRLAGMALIRRCELAGADAHRLRRMFSGLVWVMTLSSIATIAAAAWAPVWVTLVCGLVWSAANSASSTLAVSAVPGEVVRFGPWSMTGTALGALCAGAALGLPVPAVVACGASLELLQLAEPWLARPWRFPVIHGVALQDVVHSMGRGLVMSLLSYGPLVLYAALAVQVAGSWWVGPAMLAYAAGALCAGRVERHLPWGRHWPGLLVLAAIGVGSWALVVGPIGLLAGRFVSGLALFVAQGRLLRDAMDAPGETVATSKLAASSTGLGLGCGLAAPGCAAVAARLGVPGMGLVGAVACLVAAGGLALARRR